MATYGYRCETCGTFEARFPIGTAPPALPCSSCGDNSSRFYHSVAMHHSVSKPWAAALRREQASRECPEVIRTDS